MPQKVPGITARHCIIGDNCRRVQGGDVEAFNVAVARLRDSYLDCVKGWGDTKGVQYHLVLSVERPATGG